MKIGFDAKRLFFNGSGLGNYSRSTLDIADKYFPQEYSYVLFSPREGNRHGFQTSDRMNVVTPRGVMKRFPSLWRRYFMGRDIRKQNLDIFHGLSAELPGNIGKAGTRNVVTIHDLIFVRYPELYTHIDRNLYTQKYKRSCHAADRIIAISNQTKQDLVDFWHIPAEKIDVIYQGCSPIFSQKVDDARKAEVRSRYSLPERYIVGVGTIEKRKNLMLTLEAMAIGQLDIDLVACGRATPYLDNLKDFARRHGISDRFHPIHDCSFADLPAIYQMSQASVYTSRFEGFGIPILEALNSGVPVITTQGGVFPETGGDAAFYVDPDDPKQMADTIAAILGDKALRDSAIERGYAYAANFAEDKIAANLLAFYQKVMNL